MKQRFLSIILSVTLLASVIAGAISVSIKNANADSINGSDSIYFMDLLDSFISLQPSFEEDIRSFFSFANPYISDIEENENNLVLVCYLDGEYIVEVTTQNPSTLYYCRNSARDEYGLSGSNTLRSFYNIRTIGILKISSSTFSVSYNPITRTSWAGADWPASWDLFRWSQTFCIVPSLGMFNKSGLKLYSSKPILSGSWETASSGANLFAGVSIRYCHLRQFTMGTRKLICLQEQNLAYAFKDDLWSTSHIEAYVVDQDSNLNQVDFRWSEMLAIDNIALYVPDVSGLGDDTTGYAWIINDDWYSIGSFDIVYWSVDIWRHIWVTENVPFVLNQDTPEQLADQQLTEAWNQFNQYVENYSQSHVIPEQLGDWLFETNGSKLFPCSVQVPTHIWYNKFQTTSAPDNHIWRWGGSLIQEEGFQYSLFDTVIVGESDTGYGIRYFYDDTLDPSYNYIDEMLFANLIDSFDVVIIVPESEGILYDIPGINVGPVGYTGSSSAGVVYTNGPLVGNTLQGFCILTERAIAKQQLWNFNEGITKLYDLEVQYIDSEDSWKSSFLLWSASVFDMLNSLDGRLTAINSNLLSISSLIDHIKNAVDHIAYDDDPDNLQPWYLSLWNWITNFKPSDSDFAATLNQYNDNWEDFPELPAPSTVPLLPGGV